jgi:hypothetical protein
MFAMDVDLLWFGGGSDDRLLSWIARPGEP